MDGERISLRLEGEDLELIDAFVAKRPEFANRSHLARVALRAFIEQAQGEVPSPPSRPNRISIEVPALVLQQMQRAVDAGEYVSLSTVAEEALRDRWLPRDQRNKRNRMSIEKDLTISERM